jgi:hypothetical protein
MIRPRDACKYVVYEAYISNTLNVLIFVQSQMF